MKPSLIFLFFFLSLLKVQAQKQPYTLQQLKGTWISDEGDSIVIGDTSRHPINGYFKSRFSHKCAYITPGKRYLELTFGKSLVKKKVKRNPREYYRDTDYDSFKYYFDIIYLTDSFLWLYVPSQLGFNEGSAKFISSKYRAAVKQINLVVRDTFIKFSKFTFWTWGMIGGNTLEIQSDGKISYKNNMYSREDSIKEYVSQGCLDTLLFFLQTINFKHELSAVDFTEGIRYEHVVYDQGSEGISIIYNGKAEHYNILNLQRPGMTKFRDFIDTLCKREEAKLKYTAWHAMMRVTEVVIPRPHWWQFRKMKEYRK